MARPYVCALTLAAMLLLGTATVPRSKGLRDAEHQRASRIPSQFSQEERVAMKESLKGEPGSPSPTNAQMWVPLSQAQLGTPLSCHRVPCISQPSLASRAEGRHLSHRPNFWGLLCFLPRLEAPTLLLLAGQPLTLAPACLFICSFNL